MSKNKILNDFEIKLVASHCSEVDIIDMKLYFDKWDDPCFCVFFKHNDIIFCTTICAPISSQEDTGKYKYTIEEFIEDLQGNLKDSIANINRILFSYLADDTLSVDRRARAVYSLFENNFKAINSLNDFDTIEPNLTLGSHFVKFFCELYEYDYSLSEIFVFALNECKLSQKEILQKLGKA